MKKPTRTDLILDRLPDQLLIAISISAEAVHLIARDLYRVSRSAYLRRAVLHPEEQGDRLDSLAAELDAFDIEAQEAQAK